MALKFNPRTGEWEGETGGVNIAELGNRKPVQKKEIPQRDRQEEIRQEILKNDNYAYAIRLVDYISSQLNVKMGRTIFTNKNTNTYNPLTKQIQFSYEHVDATFSNGFPEYPTIGHIWVKNGYKGKHITQQVGSKVSVNMFGTMTRKSVNKSVWKFPGGKQGIWMIAIHEMAHRLQHDKNNGSFYRDHHGQIFQKELNDLIILFPYSECENI